MKVCVIGAGSWGTALAMVLSWNGHDVTLYMRTQSQLELIKSTGYNERYLKDVKLPKGINLTNNIEDVRDADILVLAVSSQGTRGIMEDIKPYISKDGIIVNVSKGLEKGSGLKISEIAQEILPNNPFVVLSGPSHAEEVSRKMPTTLVAASKCNTSASIVQDAFSNKYLRVYTNHDVIGVELGGAFKNIIALGVGIADGLGFGDNSTAALMTRGLVEITRLGAILGSEVGTFVGLSGIGDLIVTCTSKHSRNRRAGVLIGQGLSIDEVLKEVDMVVEGIVATEVARDLAIKLGVEMPITFEIYELLYGDTNAEEAVTRLMLRGKKHESEDRLNIKME
ncbi:MAG: NAD(P)H-dependent glycerol-3-phosphate dehydrogenase [Filifactoraceae bacterium]